MAENLTPKELLHSRSGYRLYSGKDESGEVYYERVYDLPEQVDRRKLSSRVERLCSAVLPGLAHIKEAQLEESCLRIVQGEIAGANLQTLLNWDPRAVTPERFRKWAFEFGLFLRTLNREFDWTPGPICLDQMMVTPDDHLVVLAAGWQGMLDTSSGDNELELLKQFRDFTSPLLEHLDKQGYEVGSLSWVLQHRSSCLDDLLDSMNWGAPFLKSTLDEVKPIDSFEVPQIERVRSLVEVFLSQSPWRLVLQAGIFLFLLLAAYYWSRPTPLPIKGVYVLCRSEVKLLEIGSGRSLGTIELRGPAGALGILEEPPRLVVSHERRVESLDRTDGSVKDTFLAEGPVTQMVRAGHLLCMNQGSSPGVLIYDGEQNRATRVFLTAPGVTSLSVTEKALVAACREQNKLYSFKLPEGKLLSQRDLNGPEIVGSDGSECFVTFGSGSGLGVLDPMTLRTQVMTETHSTGAVNQLLADPGGQLLWAFSSAGCFLLDRETLESTGEQLKLPGVPGRALLLQNEESWEFWVTLPDKGTVAILDGRTRSLKSEVKVGANPSALVTRAP